MKINLPLNYDNMYRGTVGVELLEERGLSAQVSIVGVGNWRVDHDCIGPRILELVNGRYGKEVELCNPGSAGLDLLDHLHGQELMIIIDACAQGGRPGSVKVVDPCAGATASHPISVHQIDPFETLAVAQHLYPDQLPRRILLVLVETENINQQEFEVACQEVIERMDHEIMARCEILGADKQ